jgi:GNAT superfamily N-acetyltransferase
VFATPELAARIDRAEGRLCAGIARQIAAQASDEGTDIVEIGGGVAVFAGLGSPTNKMIGVGFEGVPRADALDAVEQIFAARHAPLQAEVSTLADPAFHAGLVSRGYQPHGFENVLGNPLSGVDRAASSDIVVEPVPPARLAEWVEIMVTAFAVPDVGGVGGDSVPPSAEVRRWTTLSVQVPGFEIVAARIGHEWAGGGSLRTDGRIAQLCGAATLPAFRRRGVQSALLAWRLARAREAGCEVAVVTTQPASKSQQNAQRAGFHLLYSRQLLVRPPVAGARPTA